MTTNPWLINDESLVCVPQCVSTPPELDPVEFARTRLGFDPDPKQCEILRSTAKRGILNCSRQWGKTTVIAAKVLHRAWTRPGSTIVVAGPGSRQSGEWMARAAQMVAHLGVKPRGVKHNEISLLLPNGSRIIGLPGERANVRCYSGLSMLVIDEAAWVSDEAYAALTPMLATTNGDLWIMSTSDGKSGFFYETWQHGGPQWHRIQVKATDCSRISVEFLESERLAKGIDRFDREFMCEFMGSGAYAFDRDLVEAAFHASIEPFDAPMLYQPTRPVWLTSRIDQLFCIGVDLGKKQDPTAISIVETYNDEWHVHSAERVPLDTPYTRIVEILRDYVHSPLLKGRCTLAVDASGVGEPVIEMLRHADLGCSLFPVVITGGMGGRSSRSGGYSYVPKHDLMMRLQLALERGQLKIARRMKESGALSKELTSVRLAQNGAMAAEGSGHDDLVMAMALACWRANKGWNDRGSGGFF